MLEERAQRLGRDALRAPAPRAARAADVSHTSRTSSRDSRALSACSIRLSRSLGLVISSARGEHGLEAAIFLDQLGRGLRADAGHAGHVVDAVAHQRQHVAELLGRDAELLDHIRRGRSGGRSSCRACRLPGRRSAASDPCRTRRSSPSSRPCPRAPRIAGDDVVRLQPLLSMQGSEKARVASRISGNCGTRSSGGGGRCALYSVVHVVAEGRRRRVEDDGEVGRPVGLVELVGELPQHRRIAIDRAGRLAVAVGQRRQAMIGAEDVARAVDEIEMGLGVGMKRAGLAASWRRGYQKVLTG